jgi:hypothetical protein
MKNTGASDAASRGVPEWLRNGQGRLGLLSQEPKLMVHKYIQSALEEKLSTSDIGIQWCSAKIISGPVSHSSAQLSTPAILINNNAFLWWKGDVHMLLSGDQWHCVVIGLFFSIFWMGVEALW